MRSQEKNIVHEDSDGTATLVFPRSIMALPLRGKNRKSQKMKRATENAGILAHIC